MSKPNFLFTNYPDDVIRKIKLDDYDTDKYCKVEYLDKNNLPTSSDIGEDGHADIKLGYIFRTRMKRRLRHETVCRWVHKNP